MLYAVSIPTRMALEETKDLVAACGRMGIAVPLVFLNLMTPPAIATCVRACGGGSCLVAEGFRQAFPEKPQTLVYRQPEIAGLERTGRSFGRRLYQTAKTGDGHL